MNFEPSEWNAVVASLPGAHVLQTWEWGQVKARFGWQPLFYVWRSGQVRPLPYNRRDREPPVAAALILQREIPIRGLAARLRILYVPKGPLLDWSDVGLRRQVLDGLASLARQQGAIFIKLDPDVILGSGIPLEPGAREDPAGREVVAELEGNGWCFSAEQIQFRNTVWIDLSLPEEKLLANMKQKTRYNIRLAERKGVKVCVGSGEDLELLFRMYAETSVRDGFVIREERYYRTLWKRFIDAGIAEPLIAKVEGDPVAAVLVFRFARKAWYLFGMSREMHRERMPNYLLQWEAMRRAKAAGCRVYDLWGAPDRFEASDPLWGVYRFKEGLGGSVVRTLGAWDLPVKPTLYRLYTQTLPRILDVMRRRGRARTAESVKSET